MLGQAVVVAPVPSGKFNFDLSNQENGLYFIQLSDGKTTTFNKVVKTN